jgi:hypothetical protein
MKRGSVGTVKTLFIFKKVNPTRARLLCYYCIADVSVYFGSERACWSFRTMTRILRIS